MPLVKADGPLDRSVAQGVTVGKVLGDNTGTGLVFLLQVMVVLVFGVCGVDGLVAGNVLNALGGLDVDDGSTKLGLVEEEGSLRSTTSLN